MIEGYELANVAGDFITADMLVWRRYRTRAPGILESLLDANPRLAIIHQETPFLPVGTQVRIPIDPDMLAGRPKPTEYVVVYGRR
jgi:phage tail protein X